MAAPEYQKFVLLNRLVSRSASHASEEHHPPMSPGAELLDIIAKRRAKGIAIEFLGVPDTDRDREKEKDEKERIAAGAGYDFMSLRQIKIDEHGAYKYAALLFEFVDQSRRSFSVVHTKNLTGREISGEDEERGGISAHVLVRLPTKAYDDGSYRCAVEVAPSVTRSEIERFLCRQLRRQSTAEEWKFSATTPGKKKGETRTKDYRYNPRLELFADIGRKIDFALSGGRELAHMTFTKRAEKTSIGKPTAVNHKDIVADVEWKVSARQGPDDPQEKATWVETVREYYDSLGFEIRMYYRNIGGGIVSGEIHQALAGATDLVMCQKELISLKKEPKDWYGKINAEISDRMIELLNKDELWERGK